MADSPHPPLPDVLAGPLLRRLEPGRLVLWLVASRELSLLLWLQAEGEAQRSLSLDQHCQRLTLGCHAVLHLIDLPLEQALPQDVRIAYDLQIIDTGSARGMTDWAPHLLYDSAEHADFVLRSRVATQLADQAPAHARRPTDPRPQPLRRTAMERRRPRPGILRRSGPAQAYPPTQRRWLAACNLRRRA